MKPERAPILKALPERLLAALGSGLPALLLSLGPDGYPHTAYTWTAAPDAGRVRFGADHGGQTYANLQRTGQAALQFIAHDLIYLVKGPVRLGQPRLRAAPFEIALMELAVAEVKDQAWPGVTVAPLAYDWPVDQRPALQAMERAVYAELLAWEAP